MAYKTIQVSFGSGIATITLNRPEKRNAVSFALVAELLSAFDEVERSSSEVLILTGAGKAFCAGLDLDELKNLLGKTPDENVEDSSRMGRISSSSCSTRTGRPGSRSTSWPSGP